MYTLDCKCSKTYVSHTSTANGADLTYQTVNWQLP